MSVILLLHFCQKFQCHSAVKVEPNLQPLTGEELRYRNAVCNDDTRLDIHAAGFWGTRQQDAFFDARVFNSLAPSNRLTTLSAAYCKHEQEKRRTYEERVHEVEHGCFPPLVFTSGGMGKAATVVYKHLASHLVNLLSI